LAEQASTVEQLTSWFNKRVTTTAVSEAPPYQGLHIGMGGSGTTRTLGTLPGKTLILDAENGTLTLAKKAIDKVDVRSWPELRAYLSFLEKAEHDYESFALDGLSRFQQLDLRWILEQAKKDEMTIPMWGQLLQQMAGMLDYVKAISDSRGMHVAITVLEKTIVDEERGAVVERIPDLQGQIATKIAPMFNNVVYHVTKETKAEEGRPYGIIEYGALTRPFGVRLLARSRGDALDTLEEPDDAKGGGVNAWQQKIAAVLLRNEAVMQTAKDFGVSKPTVEAALASTPPAPPAAPTGLPPEGTDEEQAEDEAERRAIQDEARAEPPESPIPAAAPSSKRSPAAHKLGIEIEELFNALSAKAPHKTHEVMALVVKLCQEQGSPDVRSLTTTKALGSVLRGLREYDVKAQVF
jgi:hypothetical protein